MFEGGRTAHSMFKLPVPLLDTSVCQIKPTSKEAKHLANSSLILIDECVMLSKHAVRCIDLLLRDIKKNDLPFGGMVVVLSGDFRQILPVVQHGSRTEIIEDCIKSSPLWNFFRTLPLKANMRSSECQNHSITACLIVC